MQTICSLRLESYKNKCLCIGYRARHLQIIALGRALSILMKFDNGTSKNS